MNVFGMHRDIVCQGPVDLRGFDVVALDGRMGKVGEASFADRSGCLVVDTGFWIFAKRRLIPPGAIQNVDWDARHVTVDMTKEEILDAPKDEDEAGDEVGRANAPYFNAWMD